MILYLQLPFKSIIITPQSAFKLQQLFIYSADLDITLNYPPEEAYSLLEYLVSNSDLWHTRLIHNIFIQLNSNLPWQGPPSYDTHSDDGMPEGENNISKNDQYSPLHYSLINHEANGGVTGDDVCVINYDASYHTVDIKGIDKYLYN